MEFDLSQTPEQYPMDEPSTGQIFKNVKNIQVGAGTTQFQASKDGIFLGAEKFADAPFSVDMDGNLKSTAGTFSGNVTGGTLRTTIPASGTGSAVVIDGGNDKIIKLYYNTDNVATISGLKTVFGAENEYIKIWAMSDRSLSIRDSGTFSDGTLYPLTDISHSLGSLTTRWNELWAKTIIAWGTGAKFSCNGTDGNDADFNLICALDYDGSQLRYKYRATSVRGGIASVGGESGWNNVS
jgi:hypothetical protein